MLGVTLISVGTLKESYLRDAAAEYEKRLGAFCKLTTVNLKEEKISDSPSSGEIKIALRKEGEKIISSIPKKAYKIALCIEGKQLSSEELAAKFEEAGATHGEICLIIGSSYGLDDTVKNVCDLRLSVSKLTFPHQLMRIILYEALYRSLNIIKGTRYHK